jgi:hypothetical protein
MRQLEFHNVVGSRGVSPERDRSQSLEHRGIVDPLLTAQRVQSGDRTLLRLIDLAAVPKVPSGDVPTNEVSIEIQLVQHRILKGSPLKAPEVNLFEPLQLSLRLLRIHGALLLSGVGRKTWEAATTAGISTKLYLVLPILYEVILLRLLDESLGLLIHAIVSPLRVHRATFSLAGLLCLLPLLLALRLSHLTHGCAPITSG